MSSFGGKALNFLAKKSWHVTTFRNQETVWLAEQAKAEEDRKSREIQRQLQEEREMDDLRQLQSDAGLLPKKIQRLDWMYQPGIGVGQGAEPSTEEYLLGKEFKEGDKDDVKELEGDTAAGSLLLSNPELNTDQERWARVHNDPLLEIKRREMAALQRIKQNPVRMAAIKAQLKGKTDKEDRDGRKRRHRHHHRHSHDDSKHKRRRSVERDEKEKGDKAPGYGLKVRDSYKPRVHDKEQIEESEEVKRRREEDERKKTERIGHWDERKQRYVRVRNKGVVNMSAEEREKRLAAMSSDAQHHESMRDRRIKHEDKVVEAEDPIQSKGPGFIRDVQRQVYESSVGDGSLSDRLQRNRHYIQRGDALHGDTGGSFLK